MTLATTESFVYNWLIHTQKNGLSFYSKILTFHDASKNERSKKNAKK